MSAFEQRTHLHLNLVLLSCACAKKLPLFQINSGWRLTEAVLMKRKAAGMKTQAESLLFCYSKEFTFNKTGDLLVLLKVPPLYLGLGGTASAVTVSAFCFLTSL